MTSAAHDEAELAAHLHRLAVLIAAGLAPRAAWMHIAAAADDPVLASIAAQVDRGADVAEAIDAVVDPTGAGARTGTGSGSGSGTGTNAVFATADDAAAWRSLAAAWRVATTTGAPLAPALRGFAHGLRDRAAARRDIRIALAGPQATARIVMLLPVIAVLLGLMMGVDLMATVSTPFGAAAVIVGILLVLGARRWMRGLVAAAAPPAPTIGLGLDLLAVAAGGGGSPEAAAALVSAEVRRAYPAGVDDDPADAHTLDALVRLSRAAGAPLGELARAEAAEARNRARARAREDAERLAVRLMLPLGACILPAFLLLGVVPMLMGLLSSTAGAW